MAKQHDRGWIKPYLCQLDGGGRKEKTTQHHIVPTSRLGANIRENKIALFETLHNALHRLHGNGTPVEQVLHTIEINRSVLRDARVDDLYEVLNRPLDEIYREGIIIK